MRFGNETANDAVSHEIKHGRGFNFGYYTNSRQGFARGGWWLDEGNPQSNVDSRKL